MNELTHILKSLAYSLTVVQTSSKCVASIAKRHDLRPELERLQKGLKRHRSSGYDLETKKVPTESTLLNLLDRIRVSEIKLTDLQKQCGMLTVLEKNSLLDLITHILNEMDNRARAAKEILSEMSKKGINLEDLS
ncbi:hypothetical protein [Marinomonas gallaica]|uniref:hypothetical protein n=1 Tax=Marinomonas gallaica TaxID=1806667 RepID=UPI00082C6E24|nr:hypothetical protein [Marinomonas gallaica]